MQQARVRKADLEGKIREREPPNRDKKNAVGIFPKVEIFSGINCL
jgi:hypothetical protein